jgi:hypothetical protein
LVISQSLYQTVIIFDLKDNAKYLAREVTLDLPLRTLNLEVANRAAVEREGSFGRDHHRPQKIEADHG